MLTPDQIAMGNAGVWADLNLIKLQNGTFSFKDHEYQIEPMSLKVRRKCCMKATQGGWTEMEVLDCLHAMIHRLLLLGTLYMFPNADVVREFSQSRFNPLILANPLTIGRHVKPGGKGTDTASLKKIHDAFLYLRGARLSQKVGPNDDIDESIQLISIPVDRLVFDEVDKMEPEVIEKAKGRLGHSKIKEERYLANPSIPDFGIDKIFHRSDQRHWFRKCGCGEWTCAELSFPECVKIRKDGTGYIGCNKCGREVPIYNAEGSAEWVPSAPENTDYMHGYRWSQLTSVFNDPAEILEDYVNPPEGNLGDVVRLRLGLPYIAAEDRLRISNVLACCGTNMPLHSARGPCAMGLDVGQNKYLIIGARTGKDRYEIYKTLIISGKGLESWHHVHDMCRKFNVRSGVVDIRPYEDSAREFQKSEPYRIYLCEYKENMPTGTLYNEKTGIVAVGRTEIFDSTHRLVTTEGRLTIPRQSPDIKEFAKQLCATAKVLETNKKTKLSVYRYKKLGNEHFRNALNYFLLAASGHRVAMVGGHNKIHEKVISEYVRI